MAAHEEMSPSDVIRYTTKELLAEIRDGISIIKNTISGHELRLTSLERYVMEHQKVTDAYTQKLDSLSSDVTIQNAVNAALESRRDRGFTKTEKLIGKFIALALLAVNIASLLIHHRPI